MAFGFGLTGADLFPVSTDSFENFTLLFTGLVIWVLQVMLMAGNGAMWRPVARRNRVLPSLSGSFVMAGCVGALCMGAFPPISALTTETPLGTVLAGTSGFVFIGAVLAGAVCIFLLLMKMWPNRHRFGYLLRVYALAVLSVVLAAVCIVIFTLYTPGSAKNETSVFPLLGLTWCFLASVWAIIPGAFLFLNFIRYRHFIDAPEITDESENVV